MGAFQHDVTVIGGPEGFSAPWTQAGTFTHRFTKTGTYRLFCSLHPSTDGAADHRPLISFVAQAETGSPGGDPFSRQDP